MANVVVLGGGLGGVVAANRLRKLLPREHRVTIVDREPLVSFPPAFLRVLDGRREPKAITRDLRRLRRRGIEVTVASVSALDTEAGTVLTDAGDLSYDYLVVALGASLAPEAAPGFDAAAHSFYTLEGSVAARDALRTFDGGTLAIAVASLPYKCPAAPYEAALIADAVLRRRGVRDRSTVRLSVPEAAPMPVAGPLVGERVQELLRERDIEYRPLSPLVSVDAAAGDAGAGELVFEGGERAGYDLLLAVPPHAPPAPLQGTPIVNEA
ncbi:MAG: FAD/NAD(P)-binding oxidoreductase, partial [Dehalococcoidia bacterium]